MKSKTPARSKGKDVMSEPVNRFAPSPQMKRHTKQKKEPLKQEGVFKSTDKPMVTIVRGDTYKWREVLKDHGFVFEKQLGDEANLWYRDPPLSENEIMNLSRKIADVDMEIRNVRKEFLGL